MGRRPTAVASVLVLLAPAVLAQGPRDTAETPPAAAGPAAEAVPDPNRGILAAIRPDALVGMPVLSSDGRDVGEVAEVTGPEAGAARVLVATEGLLGIGGRTIALDPARLTLDDRGRSVVVDMTADQVDGLPEYEG